MALAVQHSVQAVGCSAASFSKLEAQLQARMRWSWAVCSALMRHLSSDGGKLGKLDWAFALWNCQRLFLIGRYSTSIILLEILAEAIEVRTTESSLNWIDNSALSLA